MGERFKTHETGESSDLEEKYRALILAGSDVIFRMNADWSVMTELCGRGLLKKSNAPDSDWRKKYIHPQDRTYVDNLIKGAIKTKQKFVAEHRALGKNGGVRWVFSRAVPITDENGDVAEWFGAASDITEGKRQQEALRESESKYEQLVKHAPAGIFEIDFQTRRFVSVNDVVCDFSGYSREELLCMDPMDFLDDDSISLFKERIDQWLSGKSPVCSAEYKVRARDGQTIFALVNSSFTKDKDGRPLGATVVAHDITERKRMEEAIHFQAGILESVNEAILVLDDKMNIIYWNKVAEKISGWSAEELMAQGASNGFFDSADICARDEIAKRMEAKQYYAGEITARRKDGTPVHVDIHIRGIKNEQGGRKGSVASFRDITDRINTETQLIKSKQRNELLADITSRLLQIKNPQEAIKNICEKAMEHLDCDVFFNYFTDKAKRCIHLNAYRGVAEETAKSVEWLEYGEAVCGCVAQEGKSFIAENITETPDPHTELIAALGIQAYACYPLKTGGKVIGTLAFGTYNRKCFTEEDLSFMSTVSDYIAIAMGRVQENNKLKDSERRALRLVLQLNAVKNELTDEVEALNTLYNLNSNFIIQDNLESIYEGILGAAVSITAASKGALQLFNESENRLELILGYNFSDSFLSRSKYMDLETGNCGRACKAKKRIFDEDVTVSFAGSPGLKYLLEEGILGVQSTPLISSSGKLVGVLNTYYADRKKFSARELRMLDLLARLAADTIERNLTEEALKESEKKALTLVKELEEADNNKNRFINILSHELRNPLATIMAGMSLLDATRDAQQARHAKEIMKRQSAQLCRLVDDLLDVTRITQNKITLRKQRTDLNKVIRDASADIKPRYDSKGVFIETDTDPEAIYIDADAARLTQAFENLLNNALKFTETGGRVCVTVTKEKNKAVISVKDSGIGMNKKMLMRLFQPFVQADESLDREGGGLGLGLSITKGIAELHGGSISAYSEGLGKGSEFIMRLPLVFSDGTQVECKHGANYQKQPLRIVVIEDNTDFAGLLCTMLHQAGYKADFACSGPEGLKLAKQKNPDVIFCDIGLPDIDGYELARRIKKERDIKSAKLVALTGYAAPQDISRCLKAGFDKHIAKPVSIETLKHLLGQLG